MQKYLIFFSILFTLEYSHANRIGQTDEKWLVKRTKHFDIHHSAQHQDLSLYYAKIAESAYDNLAKVFSIHPPKITLIINDSTDSSNGSATILPYPLVMVYPVQIGNQETLSEAGEWAKELFTHELTHIFQMYPSNGFYNWLRPIFGSIISPNLITPSWWKEGMAIEIETQFSKQGRSRSTLQNATIRSLVHDGQLNKYSLAEANETLKTWPYGNRPYFFGSLIMSEIVSDGGLSSMNHLVERQSERFPYYIETPVKEAIDRSYQNQFFKMIDIQTKQALGQIEKLKTQQLSEGVSIDESLLSSRNPRYQIQTHTFAHIGLKKSGPEIIFYTWNETEKKYLPDLKQNNPTGSIETFEFHPKNPQIIFSKVDQVNLKQKFSDLYIYDFSNQTQKQLTHSARAREPSFSDDGQNLLFISTADGKTELKILHLDSDKIESLYSADYDQRISQALYLNRTQILINTRDQNGEQKLFIYALDTKKIAKLDSAYPQIRFIKKSGPLLFFTSTQNGVSNIYSTTNDKNLFKTSKTETHLLTGALSFDVVEQKIFAGIISSTGTKVQQFSRLKPAEQTAKLPQIQNVIAARYTYTEQPSPEIEAIETEYSIWPKILPHYWIPYISTSSSNKGFYAQAQTSGHDPLDIHTYQASINYESFIKKLGFNFNYLNSTYDWKYELSAKQSQKLYGTQTTTLLQKNSYALGVLPDVFKISSSLILSLGAQFDQIDDDVLVTQHLGGYLQTVYKTFEQKVFQYYPMTGWGAAIKYENMKAQKEITPALGDYSQLTGTLTTYFSKWLPEDHALVFKIDGLYTFENVSSRFGTSNTQFPLFADGLITQFALRGYAAGQFFGPQLITGTAEYRFPIKNIHRGSGTDPFFIKTLTGAIIADGLAAKGFAVNEFNSLIATTLSQQYWNVGVEVRLSTTIGYFIPMNFVLGYYWPFSPAYASSGQTALSLQLGGF